MTFKHDKIIDGTLHKKGTAAVGFTETQVVVMQERGWFTKPSKTAAPASPADTQANTKTQKDK